MLRIHLLAVVTMLTLGVGSACNKKKSDKQSSIAKVFASDLAVAAGREAVQIHGGYGYVKDYTVERLYRDALFTQIYSETNETQRFKIARRVFNECK